MTDRSDRENSAYAAKILWEAKAARTSSRTIRNDIGVRSVVSPFRPSEESAPTNSRCSAHASDRAEGAHAKLAWPDEHRRGLANDRGQYLEVAGANPARRKPRSSERRIKRNADQMVGDAASQESAWECPAILTATPISQDKQG